MALVSTNMIFIDPVAGLWNKEPQTLLHLIFPMENRKWRNLGHKIVWFVNTRSGFSETGFLMKSDWLVFHSFWLGKDAI